LDAVATELHTKNMADFAVFLFKNLKKVFLVFTVGLEHRPEPYFCCFFKQVLASEKAVTNKKRLVEFCFS
jgi:hypothetical protein